MTSRTIGSNAVALAGARVVAAAGALATSIIAARSLGPSDFGSLVAILASAFVANTLVTFGTDTLVVREVAIDSATRETGESLGLQLVVAVPLTLAAGSAVAFGASEALAIAAIGLLPGVWSTTALAVLRGRERMELAAVANIVGGCVAVAGAFIAAANDATVSGFVVAFVCGLTSTAISASVLASRLVTGSLRPTFARSTWRRAAPFASMVAATAIAASAGVLALELFGAEDATGHFGAANRVGEGMRLLPAAFFGAAFPAMTRSVHHTDAYAATVVRVTAATISLAVIVAATAGPIVEVLFADFDGSVTPLRVLAVGLIPLTFRLKWSFELIAEGDERGVATASAVAAAVTVLLAVGAAVLAGPTLVAIASVTGIAVNAGVLRLRKQRSETVAVEST